MLGGIAAFQRFRHSQFDSGTSNQKGKTISTSLKKVAKCSQRSKGKRLAIFLVFNVKRNY